MEDGCIFIIIHIYIVRATMFYLNSYISYYSFINRVRLRYFFKNLEQLILMHMYTYTYIEKNIVVL